MINITLPKFDKSVQGHKSKLKTQKQRLDENMSDRKTYW